MCIVKCAVHLNRIKRNSFPEAEIHTQSHKSCNTHYYVFLHDTNSYMNRTSNQSWKCSSDVLVNDWWCLSVTGPHSVKPHECLIECLWNLYRIILSLNPAEELIRFWNQSKQGQVHSKVKSLTLSFLQQLPSFLQVHYNFSSSNECTSFADYKCDADSLPAVLKSSVAGQYLAEK